jgi:hypothetical protein
MNEEQVRWLVKTAMKDDYDIEFEEEWARELAREIKEKNQALSHDNFLSPEL